MNFDTIRFDDENDEIVIIDVVVIDELDELLVGDIDDEMVVIDDIDI